jgi:hypothetical protein
MTTRKSQRAGSVTNSEAIALLVEVGVIALASLVFLIKALR